MDSNNVSENFSSNLEVENCSLDANNTFSSTANESFGAPGKSDLSEFEVKLKRTSAGCAGERCGPVASPLTVNCVITEKSLSGRSRSSILGIVTSVASYSFQYL